MFPQRYRVKLIVEMDTPQGLRSGSGVYQVRASNRTAFFPDEAKRTWEVDGEAVAIDLPNGRTLFTLLSTHADHSDLAGLSMTALDPHYRNDVVESAARLASGKGVHSAAEVARDDYPILVTFDNNADPRSLRAVDHSDLASVFGRGYAVRRITVQLTNHAVTTGIEKKLAWLDHLESYRTDKNNPFTNTLPSEISALRSK